MTHNVEKLASSCLIRRRVVTISSRSDEDDHVTCSCHRIASGCWTVRVGVLTSLREPLSTEGIVIVVSLREPSNPPKCQLWAFGPSAPKAPCRRRCLCFFASCIGNGTEWNDERPKADVPQQSPASFTTTSASSHCYRTSTRTCA